MSQSFTVAMKTYFGFLPGQQLTSFGKELQALSNADRTWFFEQLKANGIECDPPTIKAE